MKQTKVGKITHYYNHLGVGIVKLSAPLAVGDEIKISGRGRDLSQTVESIQLEHKEIKEAKKGKEIGLKVNEKVKEGNDVFKVEA